MKNTYIYILVTILILGNIGFFVFQTVYFDSKGGDDVGKTLIVEEQPDDITVGESFLDPDGFPIDIEIYSQNFDEYREETIEYDVYNHCKGFLAQDASVEEYLQQDEIVFHEGLNVSSVEELSGDDQALFYINKLKKEEISYEDFITVINESSLDYFNSAEGGARKYTLYFGALIANKISSLEDCQSFITQNLFDF